MVASEKITSEIYAEGGEAKYTWDRIDANINDNRTGFDPRAFDEFGLSDSDDENIGLSYLSGIVVRSSH